MFSQSILIIWASPILQQDALDQLLKIPIANEQACSFYF